MSYASTPRVGMRFSKSGIGIYREISENQRTGRLIGKELTRYLIFTGRSISCEEPLSTATDSGHMHNAATYFSVSEKQPCTRVQTPESSS